MKELVEMGGEGGIIALDRKGNIAMPFNSEGMYRGSIDKAGTMVIQIYRD
jgi:beta-aspartyl-peptidase (threonine type)